MILLVETDPVALLQPNFHCAKGKFRFIFAIYRKEYSNISAYEITLASDACNVYNNVQIGQ